VFAGGTPDGDPISRVRVEADGTQRLWRLNDGKQPRRRVDLDALEVTDVTRIAVS
jgi:hypothetical protein